MNNILRAFTPPEGAGQDDVRRIQQFIRQKGVLAFDFHEVTTLWAKFSDDMAAGWLMVNDLQLERFWEWLRQ